MFESLFKHYRMVIRILKNIKCRNDVNSGKQSEFLMGFEPKEGGKFKSLSELESFFRDWCHFYI